MPTKKTSASESESETASAYRVGRINPAKQMKASKSSKAASNSSTKKKVSFSEITRSDSGLRKHKLRENYNQDPAEFSASEKYGTSGIPFPLEGYWQSPNESIENRFKLKWQYNQGSVHFFILDCTERICTKVANVTHNASDKLLEILNDIFSSRKSNEDKKKEVYAVLSKEDKEYFKLFNTNLFGGKKTYKYIKRRKTTRKTTRKNKKTRKHQRYNRK